MKTKPSLLLLILFSAIAHSQPNQPAKPDLSKFSSAQLTACFKNKGICGTEDSLAIAGELYTRIPEMPTEQLVSCFAEWRICGTGENPASGWPISDEIARRGNPHLLLMRYWTESDPEIRLGIVEVAYHFKSTEVADFMRRVLAENKGDEMELYWPANFLAKRCDDAGLAWLSSRAGRPQSCLQFQTTVPLFGKCNYRTAIPYLINNSIHDACLDIDDAAVRDLRHFFPHSPKEFSSMEEMQGYYCRRARQDGFKVDCPPK